MKQTPQTHVAYRQFNGQFILWAVVVALASISGSRAVIAQDDSPPVWEAPLPERWSTGEQNQTPDEVPVGFETLWARAEYLAWWTRGQRLPPLVTTSPSGTPREDAGVLGQPGTEILFGGDRAASDFRSGGRLTLGKWSDASQTMGIEASFFLLENNPISFIASEGDHSILARPFFDSDPAVNAQASELVAFPGAFDGTVAVSGSSSLLGADASLRHRLWGSGGSTWIDVTGGYRYLRLRENLGIREDITAIDATDPFIVPGTRFEVDDRFRTANDFHGAQIGLIAGTVRGSWIMEGIAKLGIGANLRSVDIAGATRVTVPDDPPERTSGGLLAQSSNIGHYRDHEFALVPEFGFRLGYQWTEHVRFLCGYSLIYWNHVARPGEQIDLSVNSSQIGGDPADGPARPAFKFHDSSYWAQGLDLGVQFRF